MHERSLAAVDVNLLVVLHALLVERHVTRAGRRIGLSQSAMSHALGRLRELFGDRLLVKSGRALRPTPRAERLFPQLERAVAELEGVLRAEPQFDPRTARRRFRLGMDDYSQSLILEPLIARLATEAPHVELSTVMGAEIPELLESGRLDMAVLLPDTKGAGLVSQRLFVENFVCIVRKGHPVIRRGLRLDTYLELGHVLVAPFGLPGSIVDNELGRRGVARRIALTVPNFLVVPFVVAGSDLVSTGPARLARRMARLLPLKLLPPPLRLPPFELHVCYHERVAGDPALAWLARCTREVSADL